MKFDEIFPRKEFPIRAKAKIHLSETDIFVRVSTFQQKPLLGFSEWKQKSGFVRIIYDRKGELAAHAAIFLPEPLGEKTRWFKHSSEDSWVEITNYPDEMRRKEQSEDAFFNQLYFGIGLPFAGFEKAEWKSF